MWRLIVCVAAVSAVMGAPQINIIAEQDIIVAPENFDFICNSSDVGDITIKVDGEINGDKFDRITNESISDTKMDFNLQGSEPGDNGTTFQCVVTVKDKKYSSDILTLQVLYAPVFSQSKSMVLYQIHTSKDAELDCNVIMANPPNISFQFSNNSKDISGVTHTVNGSDATIMFASAKVANRGMYNCTANNSIGSTTLSYNVYVGGPPNGANVSCRVVPSNDLLDYACEVYNDASDAPATALILESPDLGINKTHEFQESHLPLSEAIVTLVNNTSLLDIDPDYYSMMVYAANQLGKVLVFNETVYLSLNPNITITTDNTTVIEQDFFNFTCESSVVDGVYFVLINNDGEGDRHHRLIQTTSTNQSQSYSFNSTYHDNRLSFRCAANYTINSTEVTFVSDRIDIDVLYAPRYAPVTPVTPLNGSTDTLYIPSFDANPVDGVAVTWSHNGSVLQNNTLPDQLILGKVLVENGGNYTVHTCNAVGCGNGTLAVDVYYPPVMTGNTNGSQWIEIKTSDTYNITCTVKDSNPPVTHLSFTYNGSSDNIRPINVSTDTVVLEIKKASESNARNYTCKAKSSVATSSQVFQTFVGGKPDKVDIKHINILWGDGNKDTIVSLSMEVTDDSSAPARNITYNIKSNKTNSTVSLSAPIRADPVELHMFTTKLSTLGADQITILFYASNDFGTVYITEKDVTFVEPTSPPSPTSKSKSHAGAVAAGVLVPLFVIILVVVGVAAGWYFYKKRGTKYVRLNVQGKDIDDAGGYGAT